MIFVCGLGRCGTSLMMQMLNAAGLKCAGQYPGHEDDRALGQHGYGSWMADYDAVKVLDPHRHVIKWDEPATVIWLDRDYIEQSKSNEKMFRTLIAPGSPKFTSRDLKRFAKGLQKDRKQAVKLLKSKKNFKVVFTSFEKLIAFDIEDLASELNLDAKLMSRPVVIREPTCLDIMLEMILIDHRKCTYSGPSIKSLLNPD